MTPKITDMPKCCGRDMNLKIDLGKFWEAQCDVCSDTIYIKKKEMPKPQLISD